MESLKRLTPSPLLQMLEKLKNLKNIAEHFGNFLQKLAQINKKRCHP